ADARRRAPSETPAAALIVALPETPGQDPLPGAASDAGLLGHLTRTVLTGPNASRANVLGALSRHRWLHFSGHATQDLTDPLAGGLLPDDWETAGLITVADLTGPEHLGGEFAFLAACKTATGGVGVADEVITVAAALQHAGWRHVIGTLWTVPDRRAAKVTAEFYAELRCDDGLDPAETARALHRAVREVGGSHPALWASFIHLGP
ncbi:MAG: CHAT domain-containing protein, partial [Actinoplanes sp.]